MLHSQHPFVCPRGLAAIACALAIGACGQEASRSGGGAGLRPIELRDATGRVVTLDRPARSVVSLAPNLTEILFAIGAGPAVRGRTAFCNYPPEARAVPVVSDLSTPSFERLLRIGPDVVVMTFAGNSSAAYDKLVDLELEPFAISAETIDGTLAAIDTIGRLVGRLDEAQRLGASIRRSIDSVRALTAHRAPVSAFIVLDRAPLMTVSGGFINEALAIAGGANIAAGDPAAYPRYSREQVLRRDPEVLLVPSDTAVSAASLLASFPEWATLRAIREGRVRAIPPDIVFRPGPRLGRSVELLYRALHADDESAPVRSR